MARAKQQQQQQQQKPKPRRSGSIQPKPNKNINKNKQVKRGQSLPPLGRHGGYVFWNYVQGGRTKPNHDKYHFCDAVANCRSKDHRASEHQY